MPDNHIQLLIHAIKAIEYRFKKVTSGSNENFGTFRMAPDTRNPNEIINHMFDLAEKTKTMLFNGHFIISPPGLLDFEGGKERLVRGLQELREVMATTNIDIATAKKLLQGPILDITTHVGQIAMLNGLHGNKIPKESYYDAEM